MCASDLFRPPVIGPAMPPGFKKQEHDEEAEEEDGALGPALPPGYKADSSSSEGEDDAVVGPMPAKDAAESSVALDCERRAKRMKDKLMGLDVCVLPPLLLVVALSTVFLNQDW